MKTKGTTMKHRLALFVAVLLAPVASLHAADGFPAFSWEHVPLYAHFGYDANLKPEQYEFLAKHFSLVTIAAGRVHENAERGISTAASEIKKRNPSVKVLFYWPVNIPHGPFTESLGTFPKDGYLDVLRSRPNGKGIPMYDHSSSAMRAWWAGVAGRAVRDYSCDGIFGDGTHPLANRELSKEKIAAANEGLLMMLKDAHAKMGADKLIIFNALHGQEGAEYLPVTDGAMIDHFDRDEKQTKETMATALEGMQRAARDGKIVCFKGWPDFNMRNKEMMQRPHDELVKLAREQITFPLASFLIAAGRYSYFQYSWGWDADCGTFDWHPEFAKPLGAPKADATRDGWIYRREFEHASVSVNLETKAARIDWMP
jgi:hypothetical protein